MPACLFFAYFDDDFLILMRLRYMPPCHAAPPLMPLFMLPMMLFFFFDRLRCRRWYVVFFWCWCWLLSSILRFFSLMMILPPCDDVDIAWYACWCRLFTLMPPMPARCRYLRYDAWCSFDAVSISYVMSAAMARCWCLLLMSIYDARDAYARAPMPLLDAYFTLMPRHFYADYAMLTPRWWCFSMPYFVAVFSLLLPICLIFHYYYDADYDALMIRWCWCLLMPVYYLDYAAFVDMMPPMIFDIILLYAFARHAMSRRCLRPRYACLR